MSVMEKFRVHPRKRMKPVSSLDWKGEPYPTTLGEIYGSYSNAKLHAYRYCRKLFESVSGTNFIIGGHNCMTFSVMFNFVNPDNGRPMVAHITAWYNHAYYID